MAPQDLIMDSTNKEVDWFQLPAKVINGVLQKLTLWDLMNLRFVSKTTKQWVEESPEALMKFHVHVKERNFLKKLVKSSVKWSNLTISCDTMDLSGSWIRAEDYLKTFSKLGSSLRVLRFKDQRLGFMNGLQMILKNCQQLKELEIGTLDVANVDFPVAEELLSSSLSSVETLKVTYVAWENEDNLKFLPLLLSKCKSLKYLKIPYILSARLYSLYPSMEENEFDQKLAKITEELVFLPVKNLLSRKTNKNDSCQLKYLDVETFEFEQLLRELMPACKQSGCLLLNVLEDLERPLSEEEAELCSTIGSLMSCTKHLDLTKLSSLRSIRIEYDCTASSDIDKKFKNAAFPCLSNVKLALTNSILVSERFASCFLQQKRESVETVAVEFDGLKGSAQASVFRTPKFASSLPHLRSLSLDGFDGKTTDYLLLWNSFPLLQKLELQNCRTLNDACLIGENSTCPVFLNLKHLTNLTLEYAEITDAAMERVLSQLPLEIAVFSLPKVTFAGLSSLKNAKLIKSLMVFQCMKPEDCSEYAFKTFFTNFVNLKKHEILF